MADLPEGRVLYRWTPSEEGARLCHDDAVEFVVIEDATAMHGILLYERHRDKWRTTCWASLSVVRHLLQRLAASREEAARFIETYPQRVYVMDEERHILDLVAADLRQEYRSK